MLTRALAAARSQEPMKYREAYELKKEELESLISKDLASFNSDDNQLRKFTSDLKQTFRSYEKLSRTYSLSLANNQLNGESQEMRQARTTHSHDVKEIVVCVNNLLTQIDLDNVSNLDVASVYSSFSGLAQNDVPPNSLFVSGAVGGVNVTISSNVSKPDDRKYNNISSTRDETPMFPTM